MRAAVDELDLPPLARGDAVGLPAARRVRDGEHVRADWHRPVRRRPRRGIHPPQRRADHPRRPRLHRPTRRRSRTWPPPPHPHRPTSIIVGAGLAGLVAAGEARRRRQARRDRRPGARGEPRRTGVVVVRRPVPHRLARAAAHGHQGLARARAAGLVRHRRLRSRRGRVAAALGRGVPPVRRRREARVAAREGRAASSPSSAGPSAAATPPSAPATRCRASTSRGAPGPGVVAPFQRARRRPARPRASSRSATATASTSSSSRTARSPACAAQSSPPIAARRAASRATARSSATFEIAAPAVDRLVGRHRRQPRPRAASTGPSAWARRPATMLSGVPAYVDGSMLPITEEAGARLINGDRMWHYVEGIQNWDPVWPMHGIRILPGPSSIWLDADRPAAAGAALPRLRHARHARAPARDRARPLLVRALAEDHREGVHALGQRAEPRPDRQGRAAPRQDAPRQGRARARSRRSWTRAPTSSSRDTLDELIDGHEGAPRRRRARRGARASARSRRATARSTTTSRRTPRSRCCARRAHVPRRQAHPHRDAAPHPRSEGRAAHRREAARPHAQVARRHRDRPRSAARSRADGEPVPGLYAAGEASGFGGGGVHGYRALEGTFVGGCLFSGRAAGRSIARG